MTALAGRFELAVITVRPSLLTTLLEAVAPVLPAPPIVVPASAADGAALLDHAPAAEAP